MTIERNSLNDPESGFSLVELILALVVTLVIMGGAIGAFTSALKSREYEAARTDAIISAQAAINVLSREIGNSGYGLINNGLIIGDSTGNKIRFRTNTNNNDKATGGTSEDVTFFCEDCDADGGSVVRFDRNTGLTSGIINKVSRVQFQYWDYDPATNSVSGPFNAPTLNTGRVTITLTVVINNIPGGPTGTAANVTVRSDVTLRNSPYMLTRY
jgi:type II secretory pathway pseudopilin PulG